MRKTNTLLIFHASFCVFTTLTRKVGNKKDKCVILRYVNTSFYRTVAVTHFLYLKYLNGYHACYEYDKKTT